MILYFKSNKKRLAINTDTKTYNTNYFYLGGYRDYIKLSQADYTKVIEEIEFNNYTHDENF